MRALAGLLLAGLAQVGSAQQPAAPDRWQPVRDAAQRLMKDQGVAGLAVAVARDGKIIWEEGFGWANREKMIPAAPNTLFSLASISKPLTATGLMILVERGQIKLDQPANDYLGIGKLTGLAGDASGGGGRPAPAGAAPSTIILSPRTGPPAAPRAWTRPSPGTGSW